MVFLYENDESLLYNNASIYRTLAPLLTILFFLCQKSGKTICQLMLTPAYLIDRMSYAAV